MAENLIIPEKATREGIYKALIPQIQALIIGETDAVANMANVAAALKEAFDFFWIGFYMIKDDQLVLGPFQGPIACTRILYGKGVCGSAWKEGKTLLVSNVEEFPGHIACSSMSKSEVVVPIFKNNNIIGVLDVDSDVLADFSEIDVINLEKIMAILGTTL